MRLFHFAIIVLGMFLVLLGSCERQHDEIDGAREATTMPAATRPLDTDVRDRLSEMINIGEMRVFGPDGPQYELPQSYFDYARNHATVAVEILVNRVVSSDGLHRMNAIEFLAEVASVPAVREDSIRLIRRRLDDEAEFVRQYAATKLKHVGAY